MTAFTPNGFPYPAPTDPVSDGDLTMKLLAEAADSWAVLTGRAAAVSVATGVNTVINMTDEVSDLHGQAGNSIVVQQNGLYVVFGRLGFVANATGARAVNVMKGGTGGTILAQTQAVASAGVNSVLSASGLAVLSAGDVVSLVAFQNSGVALNTFQSAQLGMARLAPIG